MRGSHPALGDDPVLLRITTRPHFVHINCLPLGETVSLPSPHHGHLSPCLAISFVFAMFPRLYTPGMATATGMSSAPLIQPAPAHERSLNSYCLSTFRSLIWLFKRCICTPCHLETLPSPRDTFHEELDVTPVAVSPYLTEIIAH